MAGIDCLPLPTQPGRDLPVRLAELESLPGDIQTRFRLGDPSFFQCRVAANRDTAPTWWLAEQLPHPSILRCRLLLELGSEIRGKQGEPHTRMLPVCDSFSFTQVLYPHEDPDD